MLWLVDDSVDSTQHNSELTREGGNRKPTPSLAKKGGNCCGGGEHLTAVYCSLTSSHKTQTQPFSEATMTTTTTTTTTGTRSIFITRGFAIFCVLILLSSSVIGEMISSTRSKQEKPNMANVSIKPWHLPTSKINLATNCDYADAEKMEKYCPPHPHRNPNLPSHADASLSNVL
jgi:hypothetical protein